MERKCMYCETPIYECMGFVLPRDILMAWKNGMPLGQIIRELCPSTICNEKWSEEVRREEASLTNKI